MEPSVFAPFVRETPEAPAGTRRESIALEPIVGPAGTVLVHQLAAGDDLFALLGSKVQAVGGRFMQVSGGQSIRMQGQMPEYRLDELIKGW